MTHTFKIVTNNKSAVVERLLRITRHRGFILQSMNMTATAKQLTIEISVDSERPMHLMLNQLQKLYDVQKIEVS